ncbi:ABC transporter permease [Vibrio palustris]|uniref:ABC-2 family transporter protein n=1 Tax=Vibrio palustris TaxID=1918946 RepID=A0A1R4B285_9VIBR|nr:ABC transporter permease [Vibrio palustris]SJL83021.1 ABC-2 family transporter protein [Vibrio palustris]
MRQLLNECKALFTNSVVVITVFGGVFFYSFLYPLPYAHQIPRSQPIAIVNLDKSQTSYQLERMVDATPQLHVVERVHSIEDAKDDFYNGNIAGFLVIPHHFYRDLAMSKHPTLAYAGDASYFLVYGTVVEGLSQASGTLAAQVKIQHLLNRGDALPQAKQTLSPLRNNLKPTFNARMGYVDYVVPAVFVLILQQTMVMAAGLMGGTQKHSSGYWSTASQRTLLFNRTLVLVLIYYVLSAYYFGGSFYWHGVNTLASPVELSLLLLPFLLSTCFLGIFLGAVTPKREYVTLLVLVSSMPLVFSAGFIWPMESISRPVVWLANLFPSTPGIQGFLALNQMDAAWQQVADQWTQLWLQTVLWGGLAWWQFKRNGRTLPNIANDGAFSQ